MAEGRFREDLYYRLNVVEVRIPALASRREDIPLLADHFLRRFAAKNGKALRGFSAEALGVAGELRLAGQRARAGARGGARGGALPRRRASRPATCPSPCARARWARAGQLVIPIGTPMEEIERRVIHETLRHTKGDKTLAARLLGHRRAHHLPQARKGKHGG